MHTLCESTCQVCLTSVMPSSGESNIVSSGKMPGLLPGVPPVELVEDVLLLLATWALVVIGGVAVEEAEELEGDDMM